MPQEFEGDLVGAVFWGADLTGAHFRDVDLRDVTISHANVVNLDIDSFVDRVVINGVDVTAYVNERDPWYPLRAMLRPTDPDAMRATWVALEGEWAKTIAQARLLPEQKVHQRVDGEWSLVEALRHVIFAMDKWFTSPILGQGFDPIGLPNTGSRDFPWPDLVPASAPSFADALAARASSTAPFARYLASVTPEDLERSVEILENGTNPIRWCIHTVLEEEFWHNRYARRDLAVLATTD